MNKLIRFLLGLFSTMLGGGLIGYVGFPLGNGVVFILSMAWGFLMYLVFMHE